MTEKIEKSNVIAILQYGSSIENTHHKFSDIDICIVAPEISKKEKEKLLHQMNSKEKHDVKFFEDLPIMLKHEVINKNKPLELNDSDKLIEYFLFWEKIYQDFAPHYKVAKKSLSERLEKWNKKKK